MAEGSVFYAHTRLGSPESEWERLEDHLQSVATLAASFAAHFGAARWGELAGLWHDLGKYSGAFQAYLRTASGTDSHTADTAGKVDHSTAGAQHAVTSDEVLGHLIAFVIAGHHSGLLDSRAIGPSLEARLGKSVEPWRDDAPDQIKTQVVPDLPGFLRDALQRNDRPAFAFAFFTRMLFSCLVDADFLATEAFMKPEQAKERLAALADAPLHMEEALRAYVATLPQHTSAVGRERAAVRDACLEAALHPPGLFSLTVPTGGGKTLSALGFALRHMRVHGLRQIVYVAPFTTIIEQNAAVFRAALASAQRTSPAPLVLEHHSDFDPEKETTASRLATENWDAPLVVTTAVQFYESLFANRTSRCRKLHRLAKSVIVLDEAQMLPVDYLAPCLEALRELTRSYGSSVVLCTATQPAIERRDGFPIGLDGIREIVGQPRALFAALKRAEVTDIGRIEDRDLAARLCTHERVLCIVNTRSHARSLFEALEPADSNVHLSALMVPQHRSDTLARVRARLDAGLPCRVVSTQLIEAGVDIDFPVVYRSLAGLDSIAQAAGRCNRHGTLPELGQTFVFTAEHRRSETYFRETADCARLVLPAHAEPLSPEAIEEYFRLYYWLQAPRWDSQAVLGEFILDRASSALPFLFGFSSVAHRFQFIDSPCRPVIVPWGDVGRSLCDTLRDRGALPHRELPRRLGRYTVDVPIRVWEQHVGRSFELLHDRFPVLFSPELHYSEEFGLCLDDAAGPVLIA